MLINNIKKILKINKKNIYRNYFSSQTNINPNKFINSINTIFEEPPIFGVPDSLLKNFSQSIPEKQHYITANEGTGVATAAGYHLATNKIPLMYLQNSGFGNMINPLLSLNHSKVYSIPLLLFMGWRGQPGIHDEPQHLVQGKLTEPLLKNLEIKYSVLPKEIELAQNKLLEAKYFMEKNSSPYIF